MIIGIGTDIVKIERMTQALERHGHRFARRLLTASEYELFCRQVRPEAFLAKRFAVKEAAAKALGTGFSQGVSWQHIALDHDELGAPLLILTERAAELQKIKGISLLHVSLADEQDYVVAFVTLSGEG
jgi:holo-[acyl-carrier protein] synthase